MTHFTLSLRNEIWHPNRILSAASLTITERATSLIYDLKAVCFMRASAEPVSNNTIDPIEPSWEAAVLFLKNVTIKFPRPIPGMNLPQTSTPTNHKTVRDGLEH